MIEELLPVREEILRRFEDARRLTTPFASIEIVRLDPPLKGRNLRRTDRSKIGIF